MFAWPAVASAVSLGVGLIFLFQVNLEGNLWASLVLKALSMSGVYILILYVAERRTIHDYGSQILRPIWDQLRSRVN